MTWPLGARSPCISSHHLFPTGWLSARQFLRSLQAGIPRAPPLTESHFYLHQWQVSVATPFLQHHQWQVRVPFPLFISINGNSALPSSFSIPINANSALPLFVFPSFIGALRVTVSFSSLLAISALPPSCLITSIHDVKDSCCLRSCFITFHSCFGSYALPTFMFSLHIISIFHLDSYLGKLRAASLHVFSCFGKLHAALSFSRSFFPASSCGKLLAAVRHIPFMSWKAPRYPSSYSFMCWKVPRLQFLPFIIIIGHAPSCPYPSRLLPSANPSFVTHLRYDHADSQTFPLKV